MTGAVDSVAPREQPTTQNQCSCRFKQRKKNKKLDGWLRGDGEGAKKMAEQIQKMAERRGGTLGAERGKKQDGELNQLGRGNRKVKKKEKKKRWDPSTSSNLLNGNRQRWVHHISSEGFGRREGKGFSQLQLTWAGGLSQACMGGGDPRCLPHPSWSAGPGASKGKGCTTWKLWPWF